MKNTIQLRMPANKTIVITDVTKERLEQSKIHPRETMDDIINRILNIYEKYGKNTTTIDRGDLN